MPLRTIDHALSLGTNCRPKYHLRRHFPDCSPSGVFDWQVTPARAVLDYLNADFTGMFELEDLYVQEPSGVVFNRRHDTSHQHEFPRHCTVAELVARYGEARRRHDYLCARTRAVLTSGRRLLVVMARPQSVGIDATLVADIRAALTRFSGNPDRLAFVVEPDGAHVGEDWTGDHAAWDRLLSPFRASTVAVLARRLSKLFRRRVSSPRAAASG